jgi:threonine aldolase
MALMIREAFVEGGISLRYDSKTNQQFPILPNEVLTELGKHYSFSIWEKINDTQSVVRICTSYATKKEHVEAFIQDIKKCQLTAVH